MIETALKFLAKFWREGIILALVVLLWFTYATVQDRNDTIKNQLGAVAVANATVEGARGENEALRQSLADLRERNDELKTQITSSQSIIGAIGDVGSKVITTIAKQKLPESCQGKIEWLKQQAIESQGAKP